MRRPHGLLAVIRFLWGQSMESDVAYRLLRLEQRLVSYEQLHAQELSEMRQELDTLKRHLVLRSVRSVSIPMVQVDAALCNGCGECVPACPQNLFELVLVDGRRVASLVVCVESERAQACAQCQLAQPRCVAACAPGAIILR